MNKKDLRKILSSSSCTHEDVLIAIALLTNQHFIYKARTTEIAKFLKITSKKAYDLCIELEKMGVIEGFLVGKDWDEDSDRNDPKIFKGNALSWEVSFDLGKKHYDIHTDSNELFEGLTKKIKKYKKK